MPIHYEYDKQSRILMVKLSGTVSLQEMAEYSMEVIESSDIPSNTNALWDVSDMAFSNITLEFQQKVVEMRKQVDERRGKAKIAILCNYTLAEPLVKMYTILSQELSQTSRVFYVEDEAKAWLME